MNTKLLSNKISKLVLFGAAAFLVSGFFMAAPLAHAATTINIYNLQPSWTAPGGEGVWSAYYAPDSDTSAGVSPGSTAVFDGREAGIIKAGLTVEPSGVNAGHYMDEGLLGFQVPSVDISLFASQVLTYDVENQTGTNPVWVRIRLTDPGRTEYQFVPSPYSVGVWNTINAAAGGWQLMDINGNATGTTMTLADVAAANPGLMVDRVYLTLGIGDSYNVSSGVGTVGWVDKVTISDKTYDFVLAHATTLLGVAATYSVLSSTYINTSASTAINGDVGFTTPPAVTPLGTRANYGSADPYSAAGTAQAAALANLNSQGCTLSFTTGAVVLSAAGTQHPSSTYTPGVYCVGGAVSIGSTITLSGAGTYIFKSTGALNAEGSSIVTLAGASADDVFWTPNGAATLNANATFIGTVIPVSQPITLLDNVSWIGRALAFGGTVTTGAADTITAPPLAPVIQACNGSSFDSSTSTLGSVNGQGGWGVTGPYNQAIVDNIYGYSSFGCKSLRISDSVTSGSFGDQIFSPSIVNEAGETTATSSGMSGGVRQNHFEAQFDLASAMATLQPGMHMSVSPDRGDGSRMSYLRFEDQANGIHVFFDDVQGINPGFQTSNFAETDIATLDRAVPHTIKFTMDFVDGPSNDIVRIYIDGTLVHVGTSWENYFRFDTEAQNTPHDPSLENVSRTVDSLLFRESGTATLADAGNGFLIDNVSLSSSDVTAPSTATIVTTSGNESSTTLPFSIAQSGSDNNGGTVTIDIPQGTIVTGNSSWDGVIFPPTPPVTTVTVAVPGFDTPVTSAFTVGSSLSDLTFSNTVKLTFAGQTGMHVGWYNHAGTFTEITDVCDTNTSTTTINGGTVFPDNGSCKFDDGVNMIVWTKHFSTFVTYTQTATPAPVSVNGSSVGGGGGGGGTSINPYTLRINGGASQTASVNVTLGITSISGMDRMWVSNDSSFAPSTGTGWIPFQVTYPWTLTSGFGSKTVYVQFGNANSATPAGNVSASITLSNGGQVLGVSTGNQGQVLGASVYNFLKNLTIGSRGADVTALQQFLLDNGFYTGPVTGYFGQLTEGGVKVYQLKYGLPGTGYFGPLTMAKLNGGQVLGASTSAEAEAMKARIDELQTQLQNAIKAKIVELQAQMALLLQQLQQSSGH